MARFFFCNLTFNINNSSSIHVFFSYFKKPWMMKLPAEHSELKPHLARPRSWQFQGLPLQQRSESTGRVCVFLYVFFWGGDKMSHWALGVGKMGRTATCIFGFGICWEEMELEVEMINCWWWMRNMSSLYGNVTQIHCFLDGWMIRNHCQVDLST